jgi:7-cyano-7-deazaguanine synthase
VEFHRIAQGELTAAKQIAREAGVVEHRFVTIPQLREVGDIERKERFQGLPRTYIPNRNMIFYSLATSYAEEIGSDYIIGGHNAEDKNIFADTRPEFFRNFQTTLWSASKVLKEARTTILRPLQHLTKPEVVVRALELGVPLGLTWSCHKEGIKHCWECEGCRGRISAFKMAGIEDPIRKF